MTDHKQLIERLRELQDALGRPPEFEDADTLADEAADALEVLIARDKDLKEQIMSAHNEMALMTREKYPFVHLRMDASEADAIPSLGRNLLNLDGLGWTPPNV
jgi:hypothetical protein